MGAPRRALAPVSLRAQIRRKVFPAVADAPARAVFEDFALEAAPGERLCLFGPSGCGKTTLITMIAGLDADFDGEISRPPGRIGYVFQNPRLLPWRTALENVALPIGGDRAKAARLLADVGLEQAQNAYPARLSLGMARRVGVARALAVEPALMLLDEPFASLDAATAQALRETLSRALSATGATLILTSHDPRDAAWFADRVIVLEGAPARIGREIISPLSREARARPGAAEALAREWFG